jgi:hypothetical protein
MFWIIAETPKKAVLDALRSRATHGVLWEQEQKANVGSDLP